MVVEDAIVGVICGAVGAYASIRWMGKRISVVEETIPLLVTKDECDTIHNISVNEVTKLSSSVEKLDSTICGQGGLIETIGRLDERVKRLLSEEVD